MTYFLSPVGNTSQISTSGAPLSGGTITTLLAGTSTPAATYTDNTGVTPQTNPITLNTYGRPASPIWMLGGQALKFLIKDSLGNLIQTIDGVYGINDPTLITAAVVQRDYIAGLVGSTAGSSTTLTVAAGMAADSTNATLMSLAASEAKTTSAWAVGTGQGGLDTGAIANSTWYHWYLIRRPDTGLVDVIFSLSASAPTLPTNYTQYRRILSAKTNGSAQWTSFVQDGDMFQWLTPVLDVNATSTGTAAVTRTLTVPTGLRVDAKLNVGVGDTASVGEAVYLSDLSTTDLAGSNTVAPLFTLQCVAGATSFGSAQATVKTNTSAQIRSRCALGTASQSMRIATLGWIDSRGKDA